jgi:hypothetical protein
MIEIDLTDKPDRMYSTEESVLHMINKVAKVTATKGEKEIYGLAVEKRKP